MPTPGVRSRRSISLLAIAAISVLGPYAHADFTYTETTQITGGSTLGMMKMAGAFSKQARQATAPIASTVSIKGNRMARITPESTEIIDLDAETITNIDTVHRKYTTVTFEQLRKQVEEAMQKASAQPTPSASAEPQKPSDVDMKFRVEVRSTGASKEVAGLNSSESILTMAMDGTDTTSGQTASLTITNDMWMAPEIPGYDEVREFYKRYAVKMGSVYSGSLSPAVLAQYKGAGEGMSQMVKEMSKLKGTPVLQVMRMGMTADGKPLPAASEAPLPASPPPPSASDIAKQSAASALASSFGGLGGLGGFGRKKKTDPAPADPPPADNSAQPTTAAVLMESTTQLNSFSATAAESNFMIPAGFQKVDYKTGN